MQTVDIGQGGIAGVLGGLGSVKGVHPVSAQLLIFFQQFLVLLVGGDVAVLDGLHQVGRGIFLPGGVQQLGWG